MANKINFKVDEQILMFNILQSDSTGKDKKFTILGRCKGKGWHKLIDSSYYPDEVRLEGKILLELEIDDLVGWGFGYKDINKGDN